MAITLRSFGTLSFSLIWLGCSNGTTETADIEAPGRDLSGARDGGAVGDARDGGAGDTKDATASRDAGADASLDGGNTLAPDCNTRVGGVWITFNIGAEDLTIWSTNTKFNTEALLASTQGKVVTPVFKDLIEGTDCDGRWSWHPDPENLELASSSPECEGLPSAIEANKGHWLGTVDRYCPTNVLVAAYQSAGP